IVPPGFGHVGGCFSMAFEDRVQLLATAAVASSLVLDFFVRTTGKGDFRADTAELLPQLRTDDVSQCAARILLLNCLTDRYGALWSGARNLLRDGDGWTKSSSRLPPDAFTRLQKPWGPSSPLRTSFERRQALVEIDVLVARSLGVSLEELCTIYRTQFPVFFRTEENTWYDRSGRIVFTSSDGLPGVGVGRAEWNELKSMKSGSVSRTVSDDTLPGGPRERTITYVAPFDRCDRERDYSAAWAAFEERRLNAESGPQGPSLHRNGRRR
ncbi:MAG TPA: hypothetical protein PLL76_15205, partial [Thermoanaerobaculia bacterium]|nr:hypothetical protein [Thermoanaerobaculia bacterium]